MNKVWMLYLWGEVVSVHETQESAEAAAKRMQDECPASSISAEVIEWEVER